MNLDEIIEQLTETILHEAMDSDEIAGMPCQQFYAMQHRQRREFLAAKYQEGMRFHGLTDAEHDLVMLHMLTVIDTEVKPQVRQFLQDMEAAKGKPAGWADTIATRRINSKKTGRTLREQAGHPVINDLREADMYSPSHKGALQSATYIGKAEMLFTGSQTARRLRRLEQQMAEHAQKIQLLERTAADANARLSSVEDWQVKVDDMLSQGKPVGFIAKELGRSRDSINAYIRRQRLKQ